MRAIATIPHPTLSITVFAMNDKYQIKFEAGPMEQIFKIPQNKINGLDGINKMLDEDFLQKVILRFNEMYLSIKPVLTNEELK